MSEINNNIESIECHEPYSENDNNFDIILIKPNKIDNIDHNNLYYINQILSLPIFEILNVEIKKLGDTISKYLNVNLNEKYDIVTESFWEEKSAIYDIIYQDYSHKKKENNEIIEGLPDVNQFANLLFDKNIHGNVLLFKSRNPIENYSMIPESMKLEDLSNCLDCRVNVKGVKICEYTNNITELKFVSSKIKDIVEDYFELDKPIFLEVPFYKHNLNIYYTKGKNNKSLDLTNLLGTKVDRIFFCSKHSKEMYTHLSKEEVDWIIYIIQNKKPEKHPKVEFTGYFCNEEELKDELDNLNRNIIKNKYRVLYQKYNEIKNQTM